MGYCQKSVEEHGTICIVGHISIVGLNLSRGYLSGPNHNRWGSVAAELLLTVGGNFKELIIVWFGLVQPNLV